MYEQHSDILHILVKRETIVGLALRRMRALQIQSCTAHYSILCKVSLVDRIPFGGPAGLVPRPVIQQWPVDGRPEPRRQWSRDAS